jgi:hypothetical protein
MIHRACLACLMAFATSASADVPIFSLPPDPAQVVKPSDNPSIIAEYPVAANICGLAENLVGSKAPISFDLPDGSAVSLTIKQFSLIQGFEPDGSGIPPVPPCLDATHVAYFIYAGAYGKEFTMYVSQGRATGSLTGMLGRIGRAWWITHSNAHLVLRDMDTTQWSEPDDLALDPDLVFTHGFE